MATWEKAPTAPLTPCGPVQDLCLTHLKAWRGSSCSVTASPLCATGTPCGDQISVEADQQRHLRRSRLVSAVHKGPGKILRAGE